jgi:type III secretion system YscD/HrpQ family protein
MPALLSATDGLLKGLILKLDTGNAWVIGRDPDQADFVLEDTTASRRHAEITHSTEGYYLKNLSKTNPILINDEEISGSIQLKEQDKIVIGQTTFVFSETPINPKEQLNKESNEDQFDDIFSDLTEPEPSDEKILQDEPFKENDEEKKSLEMESDTPSIYDTIFEESEEEIPFHLIADTPLILKVISGPNVGAEIGIEKGKTYIIGKDPNSCEIVFQDLSVSRNHARLIVQEDKTFFIEDLESKNGTRVNGITIDTSKQVTPQDLISCGTTTFVILDKEAAQETIYSPSFAHLEEDLEEEIKDDVEEDKKELPEDWKEKIIPTKYLVAVGSFALIILIMFVSFFSLFKTQQIKETKTNQTQRITDALSKYSDVQFSFNPLTGRLFLTGHVLTFIDQEELLYNLHSLSFIAGIENNLIIDELVWKNANDVLTENAQWEGINIYATQAGKFTITGYLQTLDQKDQLDDFLNTNFPYLDMLDNRVYVDQTLNLEIAAKLQSSGFSGIQFQQTNGSVFLSGYFDEKKKSSFEKLIKNLEDTLGIRSVQNIAIASSEDAARIDLTNNYQVTGFAKYDSKNYSVVINGKILTLGDNIDNMNITKITNDTILLEKDGLKYKINYNL